jgi:hypothetical protein
LAICKQDAILKKLLLLFVDYSKHVWLPYMSHKIGQLSRDSGLPFALGGTFEYLTKERRAWLHLADKIGENPNSVLNMLFWHIRHLRENKAAPCPDRLVLQFDSASGQNKNKYMLGFGGWLMFLGWFTSVEFHMLVRSHTKDDDDQMFRQCWRLIEHAGWFISDRLSRLLNCWLSEQPSCMVSLT